ncbi:hypothetical protein KI387_033885 [Taxus chinensis]|uniref:Uncharacterized protein n=1 Tax=Taxus chinensis TaxID=29808 RepID=A0AA38BZ82_TAXCH|nr:hypothetical protein KI387_033885 [Taxus chinensis]
MSFEVVERSYFTPNGWRLATFEEAKNGVEEIKEKGLLKKWDRVRLLDGWILGSGYDFRMGNDFKGCLGYMLLVQAQTTPDPNVLKIFLAFVAPALALLLFFRTEPSQSCYNGEGSHNMRKRRDGWVSGR